MAKSFTNVILGVYLLFLCLLQESQAIPLSYLRRDKGKYGSLEGKFSKFTTFNTIPSLTFKDGSLTKDGKEQVKCTGEHCLTALTEVVCKNFKVDMNRMYGDEIIGNPSWYCSSESMESNYRFTDITVKCKHDSSDDSRVEIDTCRLIYSLRDVNVVLNSPLIPVVFLLCISVIAYFIYFSHRDNEKKRAYDYLADSFGRDIEDPEEGQELIDMSLLRGSKGKTDEEDGGNGEEIDGWNVEFDSQSLTDKNFVELDLKSLLHSTSDHESNSTPQDDDPKQADGGKGDLKPEDYLLVDGVDGIDGVDGV